MNDHEDALELISLLARSASMDPKSPRGTKPGLTIADIAAALAYTGDAIGADCALAIATQDHRNRDRIEDHLEAYIATEASRAGFKPDWAKIYPAVVDAYEDEMAGMPTPTSASRYYRWARAEFRGRAVNAAINARHLLFRRAS